MLSGDCLHMFTYPALPGIPPAHPALPSGTLGKPTILPAYSKSLLLILTGTTAILCFFGWWGIPVWIYDMFQASPGCSCIRVVITGGSAYY